MKKRKEYTSKFDEYHKIYGNRPAMECYVRAMNDYWYFMGKRYTDQEIVKIKKMLAALVAVSTTSTILITALMRRFR